MESLRAAGLAGFRVGVGDVSLTSAVLDGVGIEAGARAALGAALASRNFVEWRRLAREAVPAGPAGALVAELPGLRGGAELLERIAGTVPAAAGACGRLSECWPCSRSHGVADPVLIDLGVRRDWPYYSGIVFEAYAPGVGAPVAMGGRYDGLGERFGRARPAVGFAIALDLLPPRRDGGRPAPGPAAGRGGAGGGTRPRAGRASAIRAAGLPAVALAADDPDPEGLAAADGWRYVARPAEGGYAVLDRRTGERLVCERPEEELPSRP